ncbi:UNVERIFIED_CONTAM: hypothetical protein FKN15_060702 [Acipenser sinensis]
MGRGGVRGRWTGEKLGNKPPGLVPNKSLYMTKDLQRLASYCKVLIQAPSNPFEAMFEKGLSVCLCAPAHIKWTDWSPQLLQPLYSSAVLSGVLFPIDLYTALQC